MEAVKTAKTNLVSKLESATHEKGVEHAYHEEFLAHLPGAEIRFDVADDGSIKTDFLYVLMELKYDLDFRKVSDRTKPLVQALMYLKKFYEHESEIPTAIFIGDKDECFAIASKHVTGYLDRDDIDWSVPPSSAWRECPGLFRELINDENVNAPHILDVKERQFYFENIIKELKAMHEGTVHKVPITTHNISGIYRSWHDRILKDDLSPQDSVGAFISSVLGESYVIPNKKNRLMVGDKEVGVDSAQHKSFFEWFQSNYQVSEKRNFAAIKDRLIEEDSRRRSGDYYTPAVWAHEAHKMLDEQLGMGWEDEYVVWDCAAGTANLTRDRHFKELYLSTLFDADVNTIKDVKCNPGSEVFQFDFLNDPMPGEEDLFDDPSKIPPKLKQALESKKKMVFLINPPFGTAKTNPGMADSKAGIAATRVNDQMDVGAASQQLYAQFMWRITEIVKKYELKDAVLALYSKPLFASGTSFGGFRDYFYSFWSFKDGLIFRADEFNGTSNTWGCSFTLWRKE